MKRLFVVYDEVFLNHFDKTRLLSFSNICIELSLKIDYSTTTTHVSRCHRLFKYRHVSGYVGKPILCMA
jgi:hypothetical protein